MMIVWSLWELFVISVEVTAICYLYSSRISYSKWKYIGWVFLFTVYAIFTLVKIDENVKAIITGLANIATALLLFNGSIRLRIFWGIIPTIIGAVAEIVTYSLFTVMNPMEIDNSMLPSSIRFQMMAMYLVTSLLLYILASKLLKKSEVYYTVPVLLLIVILFILGIVGIDITISSTLLIADGGYPQVYMSYMIALCIIITCFVVGIVVIVAVLGKLSYRNMQSKMEIQWLDWQGKALIEAEAYYNSIREDKHNFASYLSIMRIMLQNEDIEGLKNYMDEFNQVLVEAPTLTLTNNLPINACITAKVALAKKQSVRVELKVNAKRPFTLSDRDMSALISNMFDNAIEACQKLNDKCDTKYIIFRMIEVDEMLTIQMENSSNGVYSYDSRTGLSSSKKERGHGLGIRQIRRLANKAGGAVSVEPGANDFLISVVLPIGGVSN